MRPIISFTAATSSLIFKDISFRGFWMSRWAKENQGSLQIKAMYRYLEEATLSGKLKPSKHTLVSLKDYEKVLQLSNHETWVFGSIFGKFDMFKEFHSNFHRLFGCERLMRSLGAWWSIFVMHGSTQKHPLHP